MPAGRARPDNSGFFCTSGRRVERGFRHGRVPYRRVFWIVHQGQMHFEREKNSHKQGWFGQIFLDKSSGEFLRYYKMHTAKYKL